MHGVDMHILILAHLNRPQNQNTHALSTASHLARKGIRRALQGSIASPRSFPAEPIPSHPIRVPSHFIPVPCRTISAASIETRLSCRALNGGRPPGVLPDWSRLQHAHDPPLYKHPHITNRRFGRQRRQQNAHQQQQRHSQNTAH